MNTIKSMFGYGLAISAAAATAAAGLAYIEASLRPLNEAVDRAERQLELRREREQTCLEALLPSGVNPEEVKAYCKR